MQIGCRSTQITSASPASMKDVQQNCRKVIWTELDQGKEAIVLDLVMKVTGPEIHVVGSYCVALGAVHCT